MNTETITGFFFYSICAIDTVYMHHFVKTVIFSIQHPRAKRVFCTHHIFWICTQPSSRMSMPTCSFVCHLQMLWKQWMYVVILVWVLITDADVLSHVLTFVASKMRRQFSLPFVLHVAVRKSGGVLNWNTWRGSLNCCFSFLLIDIIEHAQLLKPSKKDQN